MLNTSPHGFPIFGIHLDGGFLDVLWPFKQVKLVTLGFQFQQRNMRMTFFLLAMMLLSMNGCKETNKQNAAEVTSNEPAKKEVVIANGYEDLEGKPVVLSDYSGKRILLNFWATWCRPCIEEMPSLLKAQEVLEKEGYVFLLATNQSVKIINAFKARKGFEFTYVRYTGAFADLGINALPKTFIYNKNGDKVDEISGAIVWDSPEIIEKLKNIE